MAIRLPLGFKIGSVEPIDSRLALSKADMLLINDNTMPAKYFCVCLDDGNLYVYNKTNEFIAETGKFRLYSSGVTKEYVDTQVATKQDKLTSGSNIKTISNYSILGAGDLDLSMSTQEIQDILV